MGSLQPAPTEGPSGVSEPNTGPPWWSAGHLPGWAGDGLWRAGVRAGPQHGPEAQETRGDWEMGDGSGGAG